MLTDGRTTDGRTTDGRTDDGVTGILIAHLRAFGSGELKTVESDGKPQINNNRDMRKLEIIPPAVFHLIALRNE